MGETKRQKRAKRSGGGPRVSEGGGGWLNVIKEGGLEQSPAHLFQIRKI